MEKNKNYFKDEAKVKEVKTLLELRWIVNIFGYDKTSEILSINKDKLEKIKTLDINNDKIDVRHYLNNSNQEKELNDVLNEFKIIRVDNDEELDYYDRFNYISKSHAEALQKNEELVYDLMISRVEFLGIGTNKTKRRLNKIAETDEIALAIRIALEIEDKNISAKKSWGKYRAKIYDEKAVLINSLIDVFEKNRWEFGVHGSNVSDTTDIIFFEIPGCEQISWHVTLKRKCPKYAKKWDGKTNSTLGKIENKIKKDFPQIIF